MRRVVGASLAAATLLGGVGHAQQETSARPAAGQPAVTFRTDVNLVEINAVVTDDRGEFVKDLTREDFAVCEDGRLQTPDVFALVDLPLPERPARAGVAQPVESDVRAVTRNFDGRVYILVLDDLHTAALRSQLVRAAARRFIEQYLGPDDLAAVVHTSGRDAAAQELTGSRRLLLAAIDKFIGQKLPSATGERLAIHLREADRARMVQAGEGASGSSGATVSGTDRIRDPHDQERAMNARRALDLVRDVAGWPADIHGRRKALVLFSEGIDYDIYDVFNNRSATSLIQDARDAVAAAQRANVGIYAIDARGLTQLGDEDITIASLSENPQARDVSRAAFQQELLLAQESLIALAEETGGVAAVRTNDIAGALGRIARESSTYYLLGYYTDPGRAPGRFRKIDVRVKRPGLRVRARRGYVPADPKALARTRAMEAKAGTSPALRAALISPLPTGGVPLRVVAAPFKGTGKNASVLLAIEIDGRSLGFDQQDGRFTQRLEVSVVAADYKGDVRGTDRQTLDLRLRPETFQTFGQTGGVRLLSRLELPPSRYQIRIGAHEAVGGAIGTLPYDLEVPDYAKAGFALSGVVLTSSGAGSMMTARPDAQLKDVLPLPPMARRAFSQAETLAFLAELYDQSSRSARTVDLMAAVRSEADGRVVFTLRDERAIEAGGKAEAHGFRGEIPLADVPPGAYVLRIEATARGGTHSAVREVPFEVRVEGERVTSVTSASTRG